METALTISVPIQAEPEIGLNWADIKAVFNTEEERQEEVDKERAKGKTVTREGVGVLWDDLYREVA